MAKKTLHREWGIPAESLIQPQTPVRSRGRPSSVIRDLSYDAKQERLQITFMTGKVYIYEDVPAEVFASLESAASRGSYFNKHIRDHFSCREVTPAG